MANSIHHLVNQFDLQTRLFNNVTDGVSDAQSHQAMSDNTNHLAWLVGHTVSTRYMLANGLGIQDQEPYPDLFSDRRGIDRAATYPGMADLTRTWNDLSAKISGALRNLPEEALASPIPEPVPTGGTLADLIAFICHHEAYTIGQMGIVRKYHGLPAMKY